MQLTARNHYDPRASPWRHYEVLKELGDRYAALREHHKARECYEQAAALAPDRSEPYVALGTIALQTGELLEARKFFGIAAAIDPRCAEAYGGLAMVHQQRQDYAAAFEMYLKCLEIDGDNLVALLGLFQTSCRMGTFAKIIHFLESYLVKHPGDTAVLFCLATLYARDGKLPEARQALRSVLAAEPDKAEAAEMLAKVQKALGDVRARGGRGA